MNFKNKRILITAGPTWVPIDSVRVISNIATGETGVLLAKEAARQGFKVTLFLGPVFDCCLDGPFKIIKFKFYEELRSGLKKELSLRRYDYVIHSAAVSDFKPVHKFKGKIHSGKELSLTLEPLPKIIRDIRRFAPEIKLVMFKLESGVSNSALIKRAKIAQDEAGAELAVANSLNPYRAFIIDKKGNTFFAKTKIELTRKLLKILNLTLNT